MLAAPDFDASVITGVSAVSEKPQSIPTVVVSVATDPLPIPPNNPPASLISSPTIIPTTANTTPASPISSSIPPTPKPVVDTSQLPTVDQMVGELKASGVLSAPTSLPKPEAPTSIPTPDTAVAENTNFAQVFTPTALPDPSQAIQLANTAPEYQRPTAKNLLSQIEEKPHISMLTWVIPLALICLLGAAGVLMYSQMRSNGDTQFSLQQATQTIFNP